MSEGKRDLLLPMVLSAVVAASGTFLMHRRRKAGGKAKPQHAFRNVFADNTDARFEHRRTDAPHHLAVQQHPYSDEVDSALEAAIAQQGFRTLFDIQKPPTLHDTPLHFVSSPIELSAALEDMQEQLESVPCLAMDVEHHHKHSYLGFTCLLQLSTGAQDYVIDAIALHDHLPQLNTILSDPHILKVMHGADNDVLWLQRDYQAYLVNILDTEKCCQVLKISQRSLAHLLRLFCNVETDKSLQLADWRIRPLPDGMMEYARTDAHFLPYIARCLQQELLRAKHSNGHSSPMTLALQRSANVTRHLYEKPTSEAAAASAANHVLRKVHASASTPGQSQAAVTRLESIVHELCRWRDQTARLEDEGVQSIVPDSTLLLMAQEKPQDVASTLRISAIGRAEDNSYTFTKQHAQEVCNMLRKSTGPAHPEADEAAIKELASGTISQSRDHGSAEDKAAFRRQMRVSKFSARTPVYQNCKMLSADGSLLCHCDLRKLKWYQARGLADKVADDPPTIQLKFEHKATDQLTGSDDFYTHSKENRCVACGDDSHFLRYRVVPACYRRHFPLHMKSHRSHDILLLCVDCHELAHSSAEAVKRKVAEEFDIPLVPGYAKAPRICPGESQQPVGTRSPVHPYNVRRSALALEKYGAQMPEGRRQQLRKMVLQHAGKDVSLAVHELDAETMEMGLIAGLGARSRRRFYRRIEARSDAAADQQHHADTADSPSDQLSGKHEQLQKQLQSGSEQHNTSDSDDAGSDNEHDNGHGSSPRSKESNHSMHADEGPGIQDSHCGQQAAAGSSHQARTRQAAVQAAAGIAQHCGPKPGKQTEQPANPRISAFADKDGGDSIYANCHPDTSSRPPPTSSSLPPESNAAESSDAADAAQVSSTAESASDASVEAHNVASQRPAGHPDSSKTGNQDIPGRGAGSNDLGRPGRASASRRARWTAANGHLALQDDSNLSTDSASHMLHGKLVVAACQERAGVDGISQLATRFRTAFVQALHPAFLPPAWEIDHSAQREFGSYSKYREPVSGDV
ncbi:hypothetical protein WJX74_010568 [Apatococcus lobatus]|uniref:HRDC domain-containing protein n=1 Tax=Apatococcus lobatus TaxID=904363 RepID=A0AAW1QL70_9CHLO